MVNSGLKGLNIQILYDQTLENHSDYRHIIYDVSGVMLLATANGDAIRGAPSCTVWTRACVRAVKAATASFRGPLSAADDTFFLKCITAATRLNIFVVLPY